MGKLITKKIRGFSWKAKISLVLSFTVLFSVFMYQGWYKPKKAQAADKVIILTSGTSWTVPADWSATNTIEVIGGGGAGSSSAQGSAGGGGGAYAKVTNVAGLSGSVTINVGAGGTDGVVVPTATWFNGADCASASVCGDFGTNALNNTAGTGGTTGNSVGTVLYAGGSGGIGNTTGDTGGGGGGAAGPSGSGKAGGTGISGAASGGGGGSNGGASAAGGNSTATVGGKGGNGFSGTGGPNGTVNAGTNATAGTGAGGSGAGGTTVTPGGDGAMQVVWTATDLTTAGPGGGGGGAGNNGTGGSAGGFGGGGGGGETLGGSGTGGVIVITYTPAVDTTPPTVSSTTPASGATDVTVNSSLQVVFNENIDCTSAAAGNISMAGATVGAPSCSAPTTTITYPISGQAGNTLYTYTIGGVKDVIGNTMATTANRTYTTAAAPEAPNAVSATGTAIAAAATDTQANVVMQRLTLNSDTVTDSNNQVVLSTLTLDDAGNATAIATVKVYISSTSSATLPANAILLGGKSNWDGASTVLGLVGGKVIDRTVAAGTPKYLYIVYDMAFDQSTRTVQAHVSNVGVSSPDTSAALNLSSTLITLSDGSNVAVVTACTSCHAMPPLDASGTARNTPATAVVGSHLKHGNTCNNCHVTPATQTSADFDHRNGNIEFIGGVGYTKGTSFAQTNPTDGTGLGTCNTATCHNAYGTTGIATPKWGVAATCASCHAASPATGNHALHMALGGAACNQCHDGAVAGSNGGTAHLDYNIDVTGGYPANVARHASGSGYSSCSSASCHNDPYSSGFAATPTWGTTGNGCSACHLAHPLVSTGPATGSHAKHNQTDCSKCHAGATNNITNPTLNHNDGDIDVTNGYPVTARHAAGTYTGTCNSASCHANVYGIGTVTTPVWGDTTQGCGACHTTAIATTGPATGSHAAHNETNCSLCHAGATNSTTGPTLNHADGDIDVLNGYPVTAKHAAGSYTGTCTSASCHADPYSAAYAETPVWGNSGAGCSSCHGAKPITATGPATGAHSKHMGLTGAACTQCHNAGTSATSSPTTAHGNANVDVIGGYPTTVAKHAFGTGYSSCSTSNYCHSSGQSSTGTAVPVYATSPNWGSTGTTCASCHKNMDSDATAYGNHVKHAQTYAISCASCHNGYTETTVAAATHVNNLIETSFSGTLATGTTYSQANGAVGNGYGNCTTSYCHSSGQAANGTATPVYASATWGATTNCGSCHLNFDSNASATGDHVAHAQTYPYTCATCHDGYTETTSAPATHVNKVVELAFSGTLATGTTYSQGNGAVGNGFGTCSTSYCHSTGQSTTGGATPTYPGTAPTWGTTTMNCGSCHLDFNSNASATGDHVKHAQGTANLSCATCHNGYTETTVATATHVNKTIELAFSGTNATGTTYSQGATSAVGNNYGNCSTSKCHGSGAPVWGGALYSATVICENCHGSAASSPFYSTAATGAAPTKTTAETDSKVGAHLAHLTARAAYTNTISCGTCHGVPATVTTAGHMDGSATPAFSGTALLNSASPSYVSGSCSNTYCHGAAMIGGSNNGTDTSPAWTATGYITGTPSKTGDCAACHGCPPNSAAHGGSETLAQCNGCHDHVNVDGSFTSGTNRGKHMDGTVQASGGDCLGCHSSLVAADFVRPSRHVSNGTTTSIVTNFDCIVCHSEGDANSSGTTINRTTLHSGNSSGPVDLRNVDSAVTGAGTANTNYWAWPGRRATPLAKGSANTTSRDNMDRFCMGCHDANGASTIAVNNSNDGLIVGSAAVSTVRTVTGTGNTNTNNANLAQRPFNTNDKLQNTRDTALAGNGTTHGTFRLTTYGRVLNVKSQFNSGNAAGTSWASHHNLNQFVKRYTTNNTTAGTGLPTTVWTNYVTKENYTLNGTGAGTGANAGLHCSDCHLNEVNAHGSVNSWYMLNGTATASDTDIAPTLGNSSTSAEIMCFRCHTANEYADSSSGTSARVDHGTRCNNIDVVTGTSVEAPFGNMCHGCHGGYGNTALAVNQDVVGTGSTLKGRGSLGAIHGNNETYRPGGATADSPRYRFMSGASMRYWNPSGTAAASWTAASGGTCYTLTSADQWGSCTKHGSGGAVPANQKARALSY